MCVRARGCVCVCVFQKSIWLVIVLNIESVLNHHDHPCDRASAPPGVSPNIQCIEQCTDLRASQGRHWDSRRAVEPMKIIASLGPMPSHLQHPIGRTWPQLPHHPSRTAAFCFLIQFRACIVESTSNTFGPSDVRTIGNYLLSDMTDKDKTWSSDVGC